jgi:hypothetical protein
MDVFDDKELGAKRDHRLKLQLEQLADEKLGNELPTKPAISGREAAQAAFAAGRDPGTITVAPVKEQIQQCYERRAARAPVIDNLEREIEAMKPAARKRVRETNGVPAVNDSLAAEINRIAEKMGAICSLRDMFAADWQTADLLGSGFLSYGWALHPGLTTDPTSRLNLWRKDAAACGTDLDKQEFSVGDLIEKQRSKLTAEEDEVKVAIAAARGGEPGASRDQVLANLAQRKQRIAADRKNLDAIEKALAP